MDINSNIKKFIGEKVHYNHNGQMILGKDNQLLLDLRGWGAIQRLFIKPCGELDLQAAEAFQNELGQFFADAINEKLNPKPKLKIIGNDHIGVQLAAHFQDKVDIIWSSPPCEPLSISNLPKPLPLVEDLIKPFTPENRARRRKLSRKKRKAIRKGLRR